jgi:5-methylcytosine-specific restriction protein B
MSDINPELAAAVARYGPPEITATTARVAEREDVLTRFPVEDWPGLPLERYALGVGDNSTYCATMEKAT